MSVHRTRVANGHTHVELLDTQGTPVAIVNAFLRHLGARDYSPNTLIAYAHDLHHLWQFFGKKTLSWDEFRPRHTIEFLEYLRTATVARPVRRLALVPVVAGDGTSATRLAPSTVNRILAAVSSFYEFAILSDEFHDRNPIEKQVDRARQRVSDRHRPFMDGASRQQPVRRRIAVKTVHRLPRPLSDTQTLALLESLRCERDQAMVRLMLDGGLRPGEVLGLHLEDVSYGRRRVVVRHRNDHPKGARAKSRFERVVDLYEACTLATVNRYIMTERPREASSEFVFLVGKGRRSLEPLGYPALAKLFARACERAGIRSPWVTLHALRHTHATRMWEAGMRELTLQKRLGHASPESTRIYTRISDHAVVADYCKALGLDGTTRALGRVVDKDPA